MDKEPEEQNNRESLSQFINNLRNKRTSLSRKLARCVIRLLQLRGEESFYDEEEDIYEEEDHPLLNEACALAKSECKGEKKYEKITAEIAFVKGFHNSFCQLASGGQYRVELDEKALERKLMKQEREERKMTYFKLKRERAALLQFEDYQACVTADLEKLRKKKFVPSFGLLCCSVVVCLFFVFCVFFVFLNIVKGEGRNYG